MSISIIILLQTIFFLSQLVILNREGKTFGTFRIATLRIKERIALHRKSENKLLEFDPDSLGDDFNTQNETAEELLGFLTSWLINHIMQVDML